MNPKAGLSVFADPISPAKIRPWTTENAALAVGWNTTAKRPRSVSRFVATIFNGLWKLLVGDRFIMFRPLVFGKCLLLLCGLSLLNPAWGQDWAKKLFKESTHDFATVARGAKSEYVFEIVNPYEEDVHITSVRTSCHCTTPSIYLGKDTIKTWEKGGVLAVFNTSSHLGQRAATITVSIDKPFPAEVQLRITGNIRGDIEVQPGVIDFASVDQGQPGKTQVSILHHSRRDWTINDVRSANSHLEVELSDPVRQGASTKYVMTVHLKPTALPGVFQDQLTLVTNDSTANIPVMIQGNVVPPLAVSPATLFLGVLKPGDTVTKQLVVRSKQPFKISQVQCTNGDCFKFEVKDDTKTLHLVPVTFTAGKEPAEISAMLKIETDLPVGGVVHCPLKATIKADPAVASGVIDKTTVFKPAQ